MAKKKTKKHLSKKIKTAPAGGIVGIDVITRLIAPELSKTGQLEAFKKSLYVFACISKIAEKVASVELKMYRIQNSKGDMEEIKVHPALDLLYKYNPFQTKSEFLKTTIINKKLSGDAFWYKVKNKSGKVVELWNLRPDWITIVEDPTNFIKGYEFRRTDGVIVPFLPEEIVHFKDSPDPTNAYYGMSALRPAATRIQTEDFATTYQRDFFLNSARPDAVLKNPATNESLTQEQKDEIKETWAKRHQGIGKTSKIAILEGGMEYQQISITQKDMDFIEGLRFTRDDILVAFKVPKPIVAITDDVNRANAETAMYIFLSETIKPELVEMIEKINEELIAPDFGEELLIDFVDPTPANRELIMKEYDNGLKDNYLLINEVREKEGLPPIKGGWSFYRPLTDMPMGGLPQSETQKALEKAKSSKEAYLEKEEKRDEKKTFEFKGRSWLKRKFEIAEAVVQEIIDSLKRKKKSRTSKKKSTSLLRDPRLRSDYMAMVNKKIDLQAEKLKDGMTTFAMMQKERVLSRMSKLEIPKKGKTKDEEKAEEKDKLKKEILEETGKEIKKGIHEIHQKIDDVLK
jgi:HK97 family phage portal protein